MRGNPLRELILVLVLAALLAPVIFRLTRPPQIAAASDTPVSQGEHADTPTLVRLQFSHAPGKVLLNERVVLEGGQDASYEKRMAFDLSEGLLEMPLSVEWPEGTPRTAVTVTFEPDGLESRELTFWSDGSLSEWIEVHWNE